MSSEDKSKLRALGWRHGKYRLNRVVVCGWRLYPPAKTLGLVDFGSVPIDGVVRCAELGSDERARLKELGWRHGKHRLNGVVVCGWRRELLPGELSVRKLEVEARLYHAYGRQEPFEVSITEVYAAANATSWIEKRWARTKMRNLRAEIVAVRVNKRVVKAWKRMRTRCV